MAMDGDRLGTKIAAAITASIPAPDAKITSGQLEAMWQAVGREIVDEIKNFAVVTNEGTSVVSSGSSAGSWPVTSVGEVE
jgi:hypothetical protein